MLKLYQDYTVNKGMDKKLFCATYLAFTSTINTYLFILEFFHLSCCRTTLSQWTLCLWARLASRIGCGRGGTSPSSNSTNRAAAGASAATSSAAAGRRAVASPAAETRGGYRNAELLLGLPKNDFSSPNEELLMLIFFVFFVTMQ